MTTANAIWKRIQRLGRGAVLTPADFLDLGGRAAVDQALSRLVRRGDIRRLARGLYDYPAISPRLGPLSPDMDRIAQAYARQGGYRLQVSGARAANALGLSTQVPAKAVYLTDGPSRTIRVGARTLQLKHASPKSLAGAGKTSGAVIQALRYIGRDAVDDAVVRQLRARLSDGDKRDLEREARRAAAWVRPIAVQIAKAA